MKNLFAIGAKYKISAHDSNAAKIKLEHPVHRNSILRCHCCHILDLSLPRYN